MTDLNPRTTYVLSMALLIPPAAGAWLLLRPETASASAYAMFAALVVAAAAVAIRTWKSAQATTSTSRLIGETEVAVPVPMGPRKQ